MPRWLILAGRSLAVSLFAVFTVWVHYQVKVGSFHERQAGTASRLGPLAIGNPAPGFAGRDIEGRDASLASFRGEKVVVLDFWATWCGPCRAAMPSLQKLHEQFSGRGLEVIGVNQSETPEHVRSFVVKKKYTFRVVIDQAGAIGDSYGVSAIPTTIVIDKHGDVRWLHVGYVENDEEMRKTIGRLVEE